MFRLLDQVTPKWTPKRPKGPGPNSTGGSTQNYFESPQKHVCTILTSLKIYLQLDTTLVACRTLISGGEGADMGCDIWRDIEVIYRYWYIDSRPRHCWDWATPSRTQDPPLGSAAGGEDYSNDLEKPKAIQRLWQRHLLREPHVDDIVLVQLWNL